MKPLSITFYTLDIIGVCFVALDFSNHGAQFWSGALLIGLSTFFSAFVKEQ